MAKILTKSTELLKRLGTVPPLIVNASMGNKPPGYPLTEASEQILNVGNLVLPHTRPDTMHGPTSFHPHIVCFGFLDTFLVCKKSNDNLM